MELVGLPTHVEQSVGQTQRKLTCKRQDDVRRLSDVTWDLRQREKSAWHSYATQKGLTRKLSHNLEVAEPKGTGKEPKRTQR
jgi:hypothetical protein